MSEVPQMVRGDTTSAWGLWGSFLEKVVFAVFVAAAVAILNFVLGAWASGDQYRREQLGSALSGAASEVLSTRTQMATAFEAYVALFMGDWKSNNGATRENVQTLTVNLQEPIISARSFVDAYGGQNLQRISDIFYSLSCINVINRDGVESVALAAREDGACSRGFLSVEGLSLDPRERVIAIGRMTDSQMRTEIFRSYTAATRLIDECALRIRRGDLEFILSGTDVDPTPCREV